jgi:hypothetical protein
VARQQDEDAVVLGRIRRICRRLEGAEESSLQGRPLFRVGRKRFAIFNGDDSPPRPRWNSSGRSLHFLADPLELDALLSDPRFGASPHHGDRGWLALRVDTDSTDWVEIAELLTSAYLRIAPKAATTK